MNGETKRRADKHRALRFDMALDNGVMVLKRKKKAPKYVSACAYCGNWFCVADLTIDHVQRLRQGGASNRKNLAVCCSLCNLRREPNHLATWFRACANSPGRIPPIVQKFQMVIA